MDNRDRERIKRAIDAQLSGTRPDGRTAARVLAQLRGEDKVKKKFSAALAFALVLMMLAAGAFAAAKRFGVMDFNPDQAGNDAYVQHILTIDEAHENDYMTLTVNEAVFDGSALSVTMDIAPKSGADAVFVYPRMTAVCGGEELFTDIVGCGTADFFSGFWVPEMEQGLEPTYGADYALITDDEDGASIGDMRTEPVTWTLTLDIIHPLYPVDVNDIVLDGENDPTMEDYMQPFYDAYANGRILLTPYHDLVEYASALPTPEGIAQEDWWAMSISDQLVASGAFERVETAAVTFTTGETEIFSLEEPITVPLGEDYELTLRTLNVTFSQAEYVLDVVGKNGKDAAALNRDDEEVWEFALLSDSCKTEHSVSADYTSELMEGIPEGVVRYRGSVRLLGEAKSLTIVPLLADSHMDAFDALCAVYDAQQMNDEQRALALTVPISGEGERKTAE